MTDLTESASLDRQRVIVTGGSRGIGAAIGATLMRRGARVSLWARSAEDLQRTRDEIAAALGGQRPHVVVCDVTRPEQLARALDETLAQLGGLDGVVNNAGANSPMAAFVDMPASEFRRMVEVNLFGAVELVRLALPRLLAQSRGSIVNVASMAAKMGIPAWSAYCTAKHGLLGFTKALAHEVARAGVRCNAVCPGFVRTAMTSDAQFDEWAEALGTSRRELVKDLVMRRTPQQRFVEAGRVAAAVAFLLSPEAEDITGQSINVSCGIGDG